MSALFGIFIRQLFSFAGGVAVTSMIDKFVPDKLPKVVTTDTAGKINWTKIILFIVIGAVAAVGIKYLGRVLNIKILK